MSGLPPRWLTTPNFISGVRFVIAPVLLYCGWTGHPTAFLALLGASFGSDCLDGYVARRLGQTSEFGARLDTMGDVVSFSTVPLCGWWLWPERVRPEAPFLVVLGLSYACPIVAGFLKYGRLTNYHTWGGRLSATLLAIAALALVTGTSALAFELAVVVVVLADVEEVAITVILPDWRSNAPSLWHVIHDRTGAGDAAHSRGRAHARSDHNQCGST